MAIIGLVDDATGQGVADADARYTGFSWAAGSGSPETAVSGNGYLIDTTSAAYTLTLPASPSVGDYIELWDYAKNSATNNITVGRNGENIDSVASDLTVNIDAAHVRLVYTGATVGWQYKYV